MLSDAEIMVRVQAGEIHLFAELVTRYRDRLLRFALSKTNDAQSAEDIVQDALLAALNARESYSPKFAFSTWIFTITLNLTRRFQKSLLRHQQKQATLFSLRAQREHQDVRQPWELFIQTEQIERVHLLLEQIPEAQADAIRLRFLGELPYDEIAQLMSCSISGAKRRVKLGLEKMLVLLEE